MNAERGPIESREHLPGFFGLRNSSLRRATPAITVDW
jgi:hypothetical protein